MYNVLYKYFVNTIDYGFWIKKLNDEKDKEWNDVLLYLVSLQSNIFVARISHFKKVLLWALLKLCFLN